VETRHDRREETRRQLAQVVGTGNDFDIVEAGMWIAAEEYETLDVEHSLARVRLISSEGSRRAYNLANPFARLDAIRTYLFEELDLRGNEKEYNDPRNSYLNQVLDRRLGNPLSLSILFLDVARAAGFDARGIGLPGHFVCRVTYDARTILVDPYHQGEVISEDDCRQLVSRTTGRGSLFRRSLLQGTDERAMLMRMLLNLKYIYVKDEDYERALAAVDRLLILAPDDPTEIRDRGFLHAHLGRPGAAVCDLESYLALTPHARDAESVRGRVAWLRQRLSEYN
jgi:regulator of sirC expression with transglutaminase-like and TPR domain